MKYRNHLLAVLAGIAAAGCLGVFYVVWSDFDFRAPFAEWISGMGLTRLAGYWGLFWLHLPGYFIALILGFGIGKYFRLPWWMGATMGSIGYLVVPKIFFLLTISVNILALGLIAGVWPIIAALLWDAVSIPLIFVSAWLAAPKRTG